MKIDYLKINGFGKIQNKEIYLNDGINIIFGENEAGKSSLLKFISSMLYGASKNKNGKEISDFEKFKPWKSEEFSGKIRYTLNTGKTFEVYREFKKKNPTIYNEKQEDISKEFKIDKTKGIDFFTEQTGIDEETFYNTAITEQEGIKLSKTSQNSIIQKISNLISSGDDNISYKKSLEKITKAQNEEVGTERTLQRPINLVENKIRKLLEKKKSLEIYKENMYDNSLEKEQLYMEEKTEEIKKDFLKEIKNKLENNRIKNAEINFNRNLEIEYEERIDELNKKISQEDFNLHTEKISFHKYYIAIAIFVIIAIAVTIVNINSYITMFSYLPAIVITICMFYKMQESKKTYTGNLKKASIEKEKIINEIEILKKSRENQKNEANVKQEKLDVEIEKDKKELIEKYIKYLDIGFMEESLEKNYDEILKEIDKKENRLNTIKFRISTMENESKNISEKISDLAILEEELQDAEEEKDELISLNTSYNLAKECLEKAYEQVKSNISPRFTENLCDIVSKISNNRYTKVIFNDIDGLVVEVENGSYIPASRLSIGTIDQMYISLRLSSLNEISNENLPIILDEAFAYFDDNRLKNFLRYLNTNLKGYQIIIFTCLNREEKFLKELNIPYTISHL